jgi:hypothetical protein
VRFIENALDKTPDAFLYGLGTSIEFVLLKDKLTTRCRVKRHLISTRTLKHGSQAETKPDRTICT